MANTHAIVVGGSMAGLCAARVLSDFFERVTLVERDAFPDGISDRPGVPQGRHVHALLARGRIELENLFPGFDVLMRERGAHEINFGWDFATLRADGWAPRRRDGITTFFASRALIESTVRDLLRKRTNVELVDRTEVAALIAERGSTPTVRGVRVRSREGGGERELAADLVADVSGRSSKSPAWLREIGLEAPEETIVDSLAGYSSRWFKAPEPERRPREWWWKGIWLDLSLPEHMMAGVMFPVENNRWLVTLAGVAGHYPPSEEIGFMEALGKLRSPILAEALKLAEPISPVYSNRAMANRWRHYERWNARLDGFVALGDSVCAFNPVYGQGMSTGAVSATILRDTLERVGASNPELPREFFRAQAEFQRGPWGMATGADFAVPGTLGERPWANRIFDPLTRQLFFAANDDPVVRERIGRVMNMLMPPSALFELPILARALAASVRRALSRRNTADSIPAMPPSYLADAA
jgi:2-polyprenyl-6-methoxyphenol hydroxylase-like FAD-dependent oxidoreductase